MTVREAVPFSSLTTLRVGGPARYVMEIEDVATIPEALAFARERSLPFMVLGGGSNVLAPDAGYEGIVLRMRIPGITFTKLDEDTVEVVAGAGASWDELVSEAVAQNLWGIENLAGIPGTVGAAPVQNIGAYGVEFESTLSEVTVYDACAGERTTIAHDTCGFSYRESRFKHEPHLIITNVSLRLKKRGAPQLRYSDLAGLTETEESLETPSRIASAIRSIRARKFPDLATHGTAGSFFMNPIIAEGAYRELTERFADIIAEHGAIPRYPMQRGGDVKIPLAYILDKVLGLRGYGNGHARLFENQPLVLVADRDAHASDVDALANDVAQKVFDATGITIEREVRSIPIE